VPDDPLSLRILDAPSAMLGPSLLVRFELLAGSDRLGSWQMVAQAKIWRDVLVARTVARRGSLVRDADLAVERRDVLTVRDTLPLDSVQDTSLELVENLQPGQPVLTRSVRVRPLIQRGQLVDALVRDGGLTITLKVETLEDGLHGQTVRVRNPKTRRELLGKVHDEQTVLVLL
jgi:flagella basal body P-ring formation protein FlgA